MFKRAGSELSHLFVPFAFESRICNSSSKEVSKGGLLVAQRLLEGTQETSFSHINDLRDGDKLPHRHVFNGMGYDGDNISPHLAWDDVPAGTKSFVVTCYDPDAPTGSGWWHWVVVNLPADTRVLPQGFGSGLVAMPDGVLQTRTDFGKTGYDGAAPPKGETHRYILPFTRWI